jgi:sulfonate transport system permease protein
MKEKLMPEALNRLSIPSLATTAPAPAELVARVPRVLGARGFLFVSWIAPLVLLLAWECFARLGALSPQVLPAPSKVLVTAWNLVQEGRLLSDLGSSLLRAVAGFVIGGGIGFTLGTLVGFSRLAEALLDRSVQMVRAVPFLAALPLVIVWFGVDEGGKVFLVSLGVMFPIYIWFGVDEGGKVFLVSLGVMFPIYINTVLGIRQVDPKLVELARVIGLSNWMLIRRIILPGALPSILAGVRYALTVAWLALVIAETIATTSGIGALAMDAREFLQTDVILLTIVIYAGIGVASDAIARALERRLLAWHPNYAKKTF